MKLISQSILLSKSKLNRSLLFNYLNTYIIIILILCLATGIIYGIMNQSLKNQTIKVNNILLQNTINSIEKEFANMDELVSLINSNPRVIRYLNMPQNVLPNTESYSAYEVIKDLNTYVYSNNFVKEIYIFFSNNIVISNSYKTENWFYFEHLIEYLDTSKYNIKDLINTYNHRNLIYMNDTEENISMLYYVNSLPIGNRRTWKATVIMKINLDLIASFLDNNQITEKTETTLFNPEQVQIIKHNAQQERLNDKHFIKTMAKSEVLNWEVISLIPRTEFEAELMSIRSTIICILLLSILIVIVFASYFAYRNYRPIAKLIGIVNEEKINRIDDDIFIYIEKSISNTIIENNDLKLKVQKQTEYLTDNAVEKLLKQEISNEKGIDDIIDISNIKFKASNLVVYSIKLYIYSIYKVDYSKIISELKKMLENEQEGYVFYINESNISMLIEIINESVFSPVEFGRKIIQLLNANSIQSTVGIGSYCHSADNINKSYKEALLSLNTIHKDKGEVILYESIKDLVDAKTKYYYPVRIEQEIINNVKIGNIEKVKMLLQEVYNENFKEIQLSGQISRILIYNIVSTVIKILDDLKIDLSRFEDANILFQLYNSETVNDAYNSLITTYTIICGLVNENKKSGNRYLFEKIEQYLKDEYSNSEISLVLIAQKFNLSISYLSRFFKEHAGVNFNDYLQKLRIEKAKQIFTESDNIFVEEVAYKVGYNNSGALIRAFKKYEGITPGEYKSSSMDT